jgi:hypothetical protein
MLPSHTVATTWIQRLTAMRQADPERAIAQITWRSNHHQGKVWALPEALPPQVRADRSEEQLRRRPVGVGAYLAELMTVQVTGSLGPHPEQTLTEILQKIFVALSRPLPHGEPEHSLRPDQYIAQRDGSGMWDGILVFRLESVTEIVHLCSMLHGATLSIGGDESLITAFNPRVNATSSRLASSGGWRGGRQ